MNIAIVGAGVMGRLCAISLLEQGHALTLFDKDPLTEPDNAANVSAGMLCPLGEVIHAPKAVLDMGLASLERWPQMLDAVQQFDPLNEEIFFQRSGSLALAFPEDRQCFAQLQQDIQHNAPSLKTLIQPLNREMLFDLEPSLEKFDQALWLKNEGQLCNRQFLASTTRALAKHADAVQEHITVAKLNALKTKYDWVIDCRGSGAIAEPNTALSELPLRGVRGEVIRLYCTDVSLSRPLRVMHPRTSIYVVPKPNHEFVVGATEIESDSTHPITLRSCLELLSTLYAVHPAFAEAQVLETNVGIRTAFPDNVPQVIQKENVLMVNGLYRHGWLVGPALCDRITQILTGKRHAA